MTHVVAIVTKIQTINGNKKENFLNMRTKYISIVNTCYKFYLHAIKETQL